MYGHWCVDAAKKVPYSGWGEPTTFSFSSSCRDGLLQELHLEAPLDGLSWTSVWMIPTCEWAKISLLEILWWSQSWIGDRGPAQMSDVAVPKCWRWRLEMTTRCAQVRPSELVGDLQHRGTSTKLGFYVPWSSGTWRWISRPVLEHVIITKMHFVAGDGVLWLTTRQLQN